MTFNFNDARQVCKRINTPSVGGYASRLAVLLDACIDVAESSNGLEIASGIGRDKEEFYARAIDQLLSDLMPAIVEAAEGAENSQVVSATWE